MPKKKKEQTEDRLSYLDDEIYLLSDVGEALALIQKIRDARPDIDSPHAFAETVYRLVDWAIENYDGFVDNLNHAFGETVVSKRGKD
jgi:hypothetical protein